MQTNGTKGGGTKSVFVSLLTHQITLNCYNSARYTKSKSSGVGRPVGETAVNQGAKKLAPAATHMMTI